MAWVKVDDGFPDHEKVALAAARLGDTPNPATSTGRIVAVWQSAMCYCGKYLTDGFVSDAILHRLHVDKDPSSVLRAMCGRKPLARRIRGGFEMVNYHEYQPSKKEVEEKRAKERKRKKAARSTSGDRPHGVRADNSRIPVGQIAESDNPVPALPGPARPEVVQSQSHRRALRVGLPVESKSHGTERESEIKRLVALCQGDILQPWVAKYQSLPNPDTLPTVLLGLAREKPNMPFSDETIAIACERALSRWTPTKRRSA